MCIIKYVYTTCMSYYYYLPFCILYATFYFSHGNMAFIIQVSHNVQSKCGSDKFYTPHLDLYIQDDGN